MHSADGVLPGVPQRICTHRGTELVWERNGTAASFSCHYHMWRMFTNTGSLRNVPDEQRFYDLDKSMCALRPVA